MSMAADSVPMLAEHHAVHKFLIGKPAALVCRISCFRLKCKLRGNVLQATLFVHKHCGPTPPPPPVSCKSFFKPLCNRSHFISGKFRYCSWAQQEGTKKEHVHSLLVSLPLGSLSREEEADDKLEGGSRGGIVEIVIPSFWKTKGAFVSLQASQLLLDKLKDNRADCVSSTVVSKAQSAVMGPGRGELSS